MKKITIAIDGYSSCGKSTMAKDLARELGYIYVDSGAMYRAVTLYCIQKGFINGDNINTNALEKDMNHIRISFLLDPKSLRPVTCLNGVNVEEQIRTMEVANKVSKIAALGFVRTALIQQQKQMGLAKGIVMDGRDVGTAVFPDAELKIFVTASSKVRAQRRFDELQEKGETACFDSILKNIESRDYEDTHREHNPLYKAQDAIELDNSNMTIAEQKEWLRNQFNKKVIE